MSEEIRRDSMTSVTQEDSSIDSESDTTESYCSITTSSLISSTDTDDKLTPSLDQISISNTPCSKKRLFHEPAVPKSHSKKEMASFQHTDPSTDTFSNSTTGTMRQPVANRKKTVRGRGLLRTVLCHPHAFLNVNNNSTCVENLGVEDAQNRLSTDFSDTSSRNAAAEQDDSSIDSSVSSSLDNDTNEAHTDCRANKNNSNIQNTRCNRDGHLGTIFTYQEETLNMCPAEKPAPSWEPDMTSNQWYEAGCFSSYWRHYSFGMAWYRAHMDAVGKLHQQFSRRIPMPRNWYRFGAQGVQAWPGYGASSVASSNKSRNRRRKTRARNRRLAKARQRASHSKSGSGKEVEGKDPESEAEEDMDVEMEITDEMLDFFKTSLKHRMERDEGKSDKTEGDKVQESRVNIEDATVGRSTRSTAPPQEQPGARRASEMKQLYGEGSPMIHGMETALQMTFDRTQDKFQPKLWPNMPLKIVFG